MWSHTTLGVVEMGSVSSICSAQEDIEAHEESQEDAQNIVERVYSAKKGSFEA